MSATRFNSHAPLKNPGWRITCEWPKNQNVRHVVVRWADRIGDVLTNHRIEIPVPVEQWEAFIASESSELARAAGLPGGAL